MADAGPSAPETMDAVAAVARAAGLAYSAGTGQGLSESALRVALPDIGRDPTPSTLALAFDAAGLSGKAKRVKVAKLRDADCPLILSKTSSGTTTWHVIADVALAGLATEVLADGRRVPVALADFAEGTIINGGSVAALDGPRRSENDALPGEAAVKTSFWPDRKVMGPLVLATFAINILALAIPLATMNIFDRVISNAAFDTLHVLAAGVALALVFDFLLRGLRAAVLDRSSARADVLAMNGVFGRILGARMSARQAGVGVQVNGLREFETVREYFNASAIATLGDLPFVALYMLVIWLVAGPLVVVPLIAVPLFLITALLIQIRLKRIVEGSFNDTAHKNAVATEVLTGIESVKLARGERWAAARWERAVASQLRHSLAVRFWTSMSLHLITLFQGTVTIALLTVGVYAVTEGAITPGALFAANLLASRCLAPLVAVSALVARATQVRMARQQVQSLAGIESERPAGRTLVAPTAPVKRMTFENVTFAYGEDGRPALKDVSLEIEAGERIAIIGGIGSGKSTLLRLLTGMEMPTSGRITVDGLATTDLDLHAWRGLVGVAPQTPAFFSGSVGDAVRMGRTASDADVHKALTVSGAIGWVASTGLGLDTPVGERGQGLSGGPLQTLAVARAVLGQPEILLMDEPTSHMDGRSEAALAARLDALDHRPTIITVTHRPAMIEAADRLIVMEAGKVAMNGPRADVMERLRGVVAQKQAVTIKPGKVA